MFRRSNAPPRMYNLTHSRVLFNINLLKILRVCPVAKVLKVTRENVVKYTEDTSITFEYINFLILNGVIIFIFS